MSCSFMKCPIKKCDKPTEYFLYFVLSDYDGRMLGKTLCGCFCADHTKKKKEEYENKWGRNVQVIAERAEREKADIIRAEEIKNWHKVEDNKSKLVVDGDGDNNSDGGN
ncbi:MAG TPA: hypothetical protein VFP25_00755, partial [Nitrososphaeraceae archaeon]|nr:hypothetical protein [Nitrososphaeraceae archaeon]